MGRSSGSLPFVLSSHPVSYRDSDHKNGHWLLEFTAAGQLRIYTGFPFNYDTPCTANLKRCKTTHLPKNSKGFVKNNVHYTQTLPYN